MNELIEKEIQVENLIYEIRGKQVMLDSDLARLYNCLNGTKTINQAVKRNIERFPDDFYFQLTKIEMNNLWFQTETANKMSRTLPYVFTEQGVAMFSSVLRTDTAAKVSIDIMRAFVAMRKYISNNLIEQKYINELVLKDINKNIIIVSKNIDEELVKKYSKQHQYLLYFFKSYVTISLNYLRGNCVC